VTFRRGQAGGTHRMGSGTHPNSTLVLCRQRHFPPFPLLLWQRFRRHALQDIAGWKAGILIPLGIHEERFFKQGKADATGFETTGSGRIHDPPRQRWKPPESATRIELSAAHAWEICDSLGASQQWQSDP